MNRFILWSESFHTVNE